MPGRKFILIALPVILLSMVFSLAEGAPAGTFGQVIEGAKKEGTVLVKLRSSFTPKSMERMEKEIKERFGVGLKIQFSPSSSMSRALAESIMENKVGAPPSFDLMNFSNHVIDGMKLGVLERYEYMKVGKGSGYDHENGGIRCL